MKLGIHTHFFRLMGTVKRWMWDRHPLCIAYSIHMYRNTITFHHRKSRLLAMSCRRNIIHCYYWMGFYSGSAILYQWSNWSFLVLDLKNDMAISCFCILYLCFLSGVVVYSSPEPKALVSNNQHSDDNIKHASTHTYSDAGMKNDQNT